MKQGLYCKILAVGIIVLFMGVGIHPAIGSKPISKYISYKKDIKHLSENEIESIIIEAIEKNNKLNSENIISVKKINNLLDKSNFVNLHLIFAFSFLSLGFYFLTNNNQPMAIFCFSLSIFNVISYMYFSSTS